MQIPREGEQEMGAKKLRHEMAGREEMVVVRQQGASEWKFPLGMHEMSDFRISYFCDWLGIPRPARSWTGVR